MQLLNHKIYTLLVPPSSVEIYRKLAELGGRVYCMYVYFYMFTF